MLKLIAYLLVISIYTTIAVSIVLRGVFKSVEEIYEYKRTKRGKDFLQLTLSISGIIIDIFIYILCIYHPVLQTVITFGDLFY